MKSGIFLRISTSLICFLAFVLLPCISIAAEEVLSALSKPDMARLQAEFQKKFVLGENSKYRPSLSEIDTMIAPYKEAIAHTPGVIGFAFGIREQLINQQQTMDYVFKIIINRESKEDRAEIMKQLPQTIGRYEVVFYEGTPELAWGGCDNSDSDHHDVLVPGINIGIPYGQGGAVGTCGTLGMIVWKKEQSYHTAETERYFLSAWHVLTQNGNVPTPVQISQPGNSWKKVDIIGSTDQLCSPVCSKFRYEVGLVRISVGRQVGFSYVAQKNPRDTYDPMLPPLPPEVFFATGIAKHVVNGVDQTGGLVAAYYRDYYDFVYIPFGNSTIRMTGQMVLRALNREDIICESGDSGDIWVDVDGTPIAITMAKDIIIDALDYYNYYNVAYASPLVQVFDDLGITGIKPTPPLCPNPPCECIVVRSLGNSREQTILETEVAPALHNSDLEPLYRDLRVGGSHYSELYELTFSDSELTALATETSRALLVTFSELKKGRPGPAVDKLAVDVFRRYVKKVSPKMSPEAGKYLLELLDHVEGLSRLSRSELVRTYNIDLGKAK